MLPWHGRRQGSLAKRLGTEAAASEESAAAAAAAGEEASGGREADLLGAAEAANEIGKESVVRSSTS